MATVSRSHAHTRHTRPPGPASDSSVPAGAKQDAVLVRAEHLTMVYRTTSGHDVTALDDISLAIAPGAWVALSGPSGSGKSSLLHLIGGLQTPTAGTISVAGYEMGALNGRTRARFRSTAVGFVFQSFHLMPHLRSWENVSLPLIAAGWTASARRERAEAVLAEVGLSERMQHRPAELSGGEQQRVALARAIANSPRVILADEPTGNLDAENADAVLALFERFVSAGTTVICATHDEHVRSRAARVIRLEHGHIRDEA